jgi:putative NIF3 family GTP cyclohydrolase 1 type 2
MSSSLTAREVADRIRRNRGGGAFSAGNPEASVTGIVTTFTPTLDVLRKAVAGGKNMIVSHEQPFWNRRPQTFEKNPTYAFKQDFIARNGLIVWRIDAPREVDVPRRALARSLGWERYGKDDSAFFRLPPGSLVDLANSIRRSLRISALRVIGDPQTKVSKVALTHGMMLVPELQGILQEPELDAVVIGEPVEWEASPYFMDVIASGRKMGLLVLGQEASEEPGCRETAAWLKSIVPEVPVEWIPAGEPFWVLEQEQ